MADNPSELTLTVAKALGASVAYGEKFSIYIPNKGRSAVEGEPQVEIPNWASWIRRALDMLGKINGGATSLAPASSTYVDTKRSNEEVWETTCVVYSFIARESFLSRISEIHDFVHEFGRKTRQGAVFLEFDGFAFQIDPPFAEPSNDIAE